MEAGGTQVAVTVAAAAAPMTTAVTQTPAEVMVAGAPPVAAATEITTSQEHSVSGLGN